MRPGATPAARDERWLVVVLTHDEPGGLVEECLASVSVAICRLEESAPECTGAIRIIDDSDSANRARWESAAQDVGAEIIHFAGTIPEKRNRGWRGSGADIVAFTDADCCVDPDWLCSHRKAYTDRPDAPGVVGITRHDAEECAAYRAAEMANLLIGFRLAALTPVTAWGPCSNLSLRAASLEAVAGFCTSFVRASEDVDLGLRIQRAMRRPLVCIGDGQVQHARTPFIHGIYRRAWTWGAGEAGLMQHHPDWTVLGPPDTWLMVTVALGWGLLEALVSGSFVVLTAAVLVNVIGGIAWESLACRRPPGVVLRAEVMRALYRSHCRLVLLRRGRPGLITREMKYAPGQYMHEWPSAARACWRQAIFVLLALGTPRWF